MESTKLLKEYVMWVAKVKEAKKELQRLQEAIEGSAIKGGTYRIISGDSPEEFLVVVSDNGLRKNATRALNVGVYEIPPICEE